MVLMNASKAARNQAVIVNRTNTCGGIKKAGLPPRIGLFVLGDLKLRRATHIAPAMPCNPNIPTTLRPTQRYGYSATLGGP